MSRMGGAVGNEGSDEDEIRKGARIGKGNPPPPPAKPEPQTPNRNQADGLDQ